MVLVVLLGLFCGSDRPLVFLIYTHPTIKFCILFQLMYEKFYVALQPMEDIILPVFWIVPQGSLVERFWGNVLLSFSG